MLRASITLVANVPFAFNANGNALPAGAYEVRDIGSRATMIETKDGKTHVMGLYAPAGPSKPGESKLVFHKIGNNYFLAEIWSSARGEGLAVPESKMEKEMTASNRANGGGGAETVIVAFANPTSAITQETRSSYRLRVFLLGFVLSRFLQHSLNQRM